MRRHYRFLLLTLSVLLLIAAGAAQEEDSDIDLAIRVGFDGYVNQEDWIPLRVTVTNNSTDDIDGELRVTGAGLVGDNVHFVRPIELPRGVRKEVFLYVRVEGYASSLEITLMEGDRPLASEQINVLTVGGDDWLIGIVSDAPQALGALGNIAPENGQSYLAMLAVEDLPPVASAWHTLDVLVFSDVDTGELSEAQRQALRMWVNDGGRLIIVGGTGYRRTFAGLNDLLPLEPSGDTIISLEPLAGYIGRPFPPNIPTTAPGTTGTPTPGANTMISSQGAPLVVWQTRGAGRVTLLAADPGLEPLVSWNGIVDLWQVLLSANWQSSPWLEGIGSPMYSGWSTAHQAAAEIPGVTLPSVLSLGLFSFSYVLLIGPLNYLLLRRLRRLELAWLTVPMLAVIFTGISYASGLQLRGSHAIVHRLAMVQVWPDGDDARVSGALGIWSPRRTRYDVDLGEGFLVRPMPTDFGGADTVYDHTLEQRTDTEAALPGVRIDVGAVETFVVDGHIDASAIPAIRGDFVLEEQSLAFTISGQITNESDRDLRNAAILALGEVHYLGELPAGESREISLTLPERETTSTGLYIPPSASSPYSYINDYGYYDLPSELLGGALCYNSTNNPLIRECNLLQSIIDVEGGGWQNQVYAIAWDEQPLMPITITDSANEQIDLTVYFVRTPFRLGDTVRRIPPTLMTWTYVPGEDSAAYPMPQPYDYFLESGTSAAFRFEPLPEIGAPVDLDTITMHLQGLGGSGQPPFTVALWNWERDHYTIIDAVWGDLTIQNAAPFISESGAVQILLTGNEQVGAHINRLDVALSVGGE